MTKKKDEKIVSKINPKYFNQKLVDEAYDFYESNENKSKEKRNELALRIKDEYERLDKDLRFEIDNNIISIKEKLNKELLEIENIKENGLKIENEKYGKLINPSKEEKKEHSNVIKGVEIVAKRAKIKE